eukprot:601252-Pyramimonas_sp.AAC.1
MGRWPGAGGGAGSWHRQCCGGGCRGGRGAGGAARCDSPCVDWRPMPATGRRSPSGSWRPTRGQAVREP